MSLIKIGDLVRITGSNNNWNSKMDKWIGQTRIVVSVTEEIREHVPSITKVQFEKDPNDGGDINYWTWVLEHKHFIILEGKPKIKLKLKL